MEFPQEIPDDPMIPFPRVAGAGAEIQAEGRAKVEGSKVIERHKSILELLEAIHGYYNNSPC